MSMTAEEREAAAKAYASKLSTFHWSELSPFGRAKCRTRVLTMERIFEQVCQGGAK